MPSLATQKCQDGVQKDLAFGNLLLMIQMVNASKPPQFLRLQPAHLPPILHRRIKVPGKAAPHLASWNGGKKSTRAALE